MAETHQADMAGQLAEWRGRGGGKAARGGAAWPGQGDPTALVA